MKFSTSLLAIFVILLHFDITEGNHLSRNRTSIRTSANTRRRNPEIPTNAVNTRRTSSEIQRGVNANGRIEGTNRLNSRVPEGVAPDGSSVILTPVQEGAVQSLRTMLQTGQARGTPRLIGFLIPTNDGRTRLRLMPGRGGRVNNAGMPLNLRTIVDAARRANLLPRNGTQPQAQPSNSQRRPSMVVLRPRTSASAVGGVSRSRQSRVRQLRRQQNRVLRPANTGTTDQVEVTINHTGPQTVDQSQPANERSQRLPVSQRESVTPVRSRFLDTARASRVRQSTNRVSDRRLNFLDRGTGQLTSESQSLQRGNVDTSTQNQRLSRVLGSNRGSQDGISNRIPQTETDPLDILNSPRTVNLIGNARNSPTGSRSSGSTSNSQSADQGRKVSITINTNQDPNNNNNQRTANNNNMQDGSMVNSNRQIQTGVNRNGLNEHSSFDQQNALDGHLLGHNERQNNFLTPVRPESINPNQFHQGSNNEFIGLDHHIKDHHMDASHQNDPTFIASSSQNKNRANLQTIDTIDFNSGISSPNTQGLSINLPGNMNTQQSSLMQPTNINSQVLGNSIQPTLISSPPLENIVHPTQIISQNNIADLLNDQNLSRLQNNQPSGFKIQDIFPGLQFAPVQTSINTLATQPKSSLNQLSVQQPNVQQQNMQTSNSIMQQQGTPSTNAQNENLQTLLQKVLSRLSQTETNNAQFLNSQQISNIPNTQQINSLTNTKQNNVQETQQINNLQNTQQINNMLNPKQLNNILNTQPINNIPNIQQINNLPSPQTSSLFSNNGNSLQTNGNLINKVQSLGQLGQTGTLNLQAMLNNHNIPNTITNLQTQSNPTENSIQSLLAKLLQNQVNPNQITSPSISQLQNQNPLFSVGNTQDQRGQQNLFTQQSTMQINPASIPSAINSQNNLVNPASIPSAINPQNNLVNMLQNLLQQNSMGASAQTITGNNQINDLQKLFPATSSQIHNPPNQQQQQRVLNIQMQNALQPQDFGLVGGNDIFQRNMLGQNLQSLNTGALNALQPNNAMLNNRNSLLGNIMGQHTLNNFGQANNLLAQNPMLNNIQSSSLHNTQSSNQALRELLQQNIQNILLQQNNQLLQGTHGFLGKNNATKSFPNNQLAPSDLLNVTTVTSSSPKQPLFSELPVTPTSQSLFSTFQPSFITPTNVNLDIIGRPASIINDSIAAVHHIDPLNTAVVQPIDPLNTAVVQPIDPLNTAVVQPIEPLNTAFVQPIDPLNTAVVHPIDPLNTAVVHPMDPLNTAVVQPIDPLNAAVVHPIDPLNTAFVQPIDPLNASVVHHVEPLHSLYNFSLSNTEIIGISNNVTNVLNVTDTGLINDNVTNAALLIDTYISATNLTGNTTDKLAVSNVTDIVSMINVTYGYNVTLPLDSINTTSLNVTDLNMTMGFEVPVSTVAALPIDINVSSTNGPTTTGQTVSALDMLSPHGKLTKTLKKSLGIKNVDKATLKGLISNVLRDLFKQNFIDPVKGTLKSSLNYTTMLNSVKKVLLKSKDKLLKMKQRVSISPDQMQTLLQNRGAEQQLKHLQTRAVSTPSVLQPVTPFITTQPVTIKQPTIVPPTPAQVIVDSIGNHGVITNQNIGPQAGGGVAVWFSKRQDKSLVGNGGHFVHSLSNPIVQPSGDLSGSGMAAPTDISSIPVTLPTSDINQLTSTISPFGPLDILNSATHNTMTTIPPHSLNFMLMSTVSPHSANLGKLISQLLDIALDSVNKHFTTPDRNITGIDKTKANLANVSSVNIDVKIINSENVSTANVTSEIVNSTHSIIRNASHTIEANSSVPSNTNVTLNTTSSASVSQSTTTQLITSSTVTTQAPLITTTLSEDMIRLPDGRIITNAMLEAMDPEQAELISEMSEQQP